MLAAWVFGLSSWWRRRRSAPLEHLHLVLYTRRDCHLCEIAWRQMQAAQRRHRFILEKVDVGAAAELAARYGSLVPVVTVNGKVRFRGAINPVLLNRLLHAEKDQAIRSVEKRGPPS